MSITLIPLTKNLAVESMSAFIEMSTQLKGDYWVSEHYLYELPKKWDLSYVVKENNKLLGFMIVSDKGLNHHLHRLVINKEHRNKGIGRKMMERFLNDARENEKESATLKVNKKNFQAIHFYENLQFQRVGEDEESFHYERTL